MLALLEKSRVGTDSKLTPELREKLPDVIGSTYAQLLKRPEVVIEDLVPLLRKQMPEFFERSALETVALNLLPRDSGSRDSRETLIPEDSSVATYDFSPAAHLRASELATTAGELASASPAFAPLPAQAAPSSMPPHGLSAEVRNELKSIETEIKYSGYLLQQQRAMDRLKKAEQRRIPEWFDYSAVSGLSKEMLEKLTRVRPHTVGQALGIPGVTPAAASLINIFIDIQGRNHAQATAAN